MRDNLGAVLIVGFGLVVALAVWVETGWPLVKAWMIASGSQP